MSRPPRQPVSPHDRRRFEQALPALPKGHGGLERGLRLITRLAFRLFDWRLEVDVEALPIGATGRPGAGCIVAPAPHRAWVEPFLLLSAWPAHGAHLVWLADGPTATASWWRRELLPRLGVIPITGRAGGPSSYAGLAAQALQAGAAVVIFPEVGPASEPDRLRRISAGFAYVARCSGAPVVPVAIGGTHRIVRSSRFSLQVLAPLDPGAADPRPFRPAVRPAAHALAEDYEAAVSDALPALNARTDALGPRDDRWPWLSRLLR